MIEISHIFKARCKPKGKTNKNFQKKIKIKFEEVFVISYPIIFIRDI